MYLVLLNVEIYVWYTPALLTVDAFRRNEKDIFVRFKSTVLKRIIWEYSVDDKLRDI